MKKLITLLSTLILSLTAAHAQEELTVVIDDAQLMLFSEFYTPYMYEPQYSDVEMQKSWPMFHIPKGTKVLATEYIYQGDILRVKLNDGSIGFMHTSSFADNSDMTINITCQFAELPAGKYQMVGKGPMKYMSVGAPFSIAPEYLRYKSLETGKIYKVDMTTIHYAYDRNRDTTYTHKVFYSNFLRKHPGIKEYDHDDSIFYKLKDNELPINYIGYSKSFIESILGPAWSYAGPGLKRYEEYTYACYRNVSYKFNNGSRKKHGGLVIYYDKDLRAVHMEKKGFTHSGEGRTKLRTPYVIGAEPDPEIEEKIEKSKVQGPLKYIEAEPWQEAYSAPSFLNGLYPRAFCIVENDMHLTRPWHIFFALAIGIILMGIVTILLSFLLPFSNKATGTFVAIANFSFTLYAIVYIWRFNFIPAVCASLVYLWITTNFVVFAPAPVRKRKCKSCKSKTKNADKIKAIRSETISLSEPSTIPGHGNGILVNSAEASSQSKTWNRRTTIILTWDITETMKCRECGKVWEEKKYDTKEVIGPIAFYKDDMAITGNEKAIRIYDPRTGVIYDESGKVISHMDSDTRSSKHSCHYDFNVYVKYLQRYLGGDADALKEYENLRFGNYFPR